MRRQIEPELLDHLPASDPRAMESRGDLRRLNAWMGNAAVLERILRSESGDRLIRRVVDLGAGDGTFMLCLAGRLAALWRPVEVLLLDRQAMISAGTLGKFAELGWNAAAVQADALDWLENGSPRQCDLIVANLFLHHFPEPMLQKMFREAAGRTAVFLSCDPRRSLAALAAAKSIWAIGCNGVTRHDACASVRAGFAGRELSSLWPQETGWRLRETSAGLFSHSFLAEKGRP
ncbi:MAG: class I SAM-dependent methyltransferase [Verrucomicrobia bacterium]|nr:class I SAM-dependent methyltransferase [Verrucomicrobiota bacterium]